MAPFAMRLYRLIVVPVPDSVIGVLRVRVIAEVRELVIGTNAVEVAYLHPRRARADERRRDEGMDYEGGSLVELIEVCLHIPVCAAPESLRLACTSTADPPDITNFVGSLVADDGAPVLYGVRLGLGDHSAEGSRYQGWAVSVDGGGATTGATSPSAASRASM